MSAAEKEAIRCLLAKTLRDRSSAVMQDAILKTVLLFVRARSAGLLEVTLDGEQVEQIH